MTSNSSGSLTPRQLEVAHLLAERWPGRVPYKAIARELGVSIRTVEMTVQRAALRLGGDGYPRDRLLCFVLQITPPEDEDYDDAA